MRFTNLLLGVFFILAVHSSHAMITSSKALQKCASTACMCEGLWAGQTLPEIYGDAKKNNIPVFNQGCLGGGKIEPEFFNTLSPKNIECMLRNGTIRAQEWGKKNKAVCMMTIAAAHGARGHLNQAAFQASSLNHASSLKFFASCGATLSHNPVNSPLFFAQTGAVIHHLLHLYSLDPNRVDRCGATPLHWAMAVDREPGCVEELLKVSPGTVSAVDLDGWNALHCLTLMQHEDTESFIEKIVLLHRAGSDFNALTPEGETPMSILYRRSRSSLLAKKEGLRLMEAFGAQSCIEDAENIRCFLYGNSGEHAKFGLHELNWKGFQEAPAIQQVPQ